MSRDRISCSISLVIACMAWFRRRQGYLSYDYFSVTLSFRTESSYAAAKIHMHFWKHLQGSNLFPIFTCRALVRNQTLMISFLCNALFAGLQHDTTLYSLSALDREISLKNIHANNMTRARFPLLVGLRLCAFGAQLPSEFASELPFFAQQPLGCFMTDNALVLNIKISLKYA